MRFEHGVDFAMPSLAIDRAANLISTLAGGQVAPGRLDVCPAPLHPTHIRARVSRINQLLNTNLDADMVCHILKRLGCEIEANGEALTVVAPSFRPDLQREVDLVEEVGRIHGYENIVASSVAKGTLGTTANPQLRLQSSIRHRLAGLGLDEVVSNTIIEQKWLELMNCDLDSVIKLVNPPTEDQRIMRPSLIPSLLDIARRNFNQRAATVAIFEIGKCFTKTQETLRLAGLWTGSSTASSWQAYHREVEIWDLKGLLEAFLDSSAMSFAPANSPLFRRGQVVQVRIDDQLAGFLGAVAPALSVAFDIERPVYIFDLDFQILAQYWNQHGSTFRPLPKFPPLERDLAVVIDDSINGAEVVEQIRASSPQLIESVEPFDLYRGDQIEDGRKSLTFSIRLRSSEKTLKDEEADSVMETILKRLQNAFGAQLR
jgi:phenylalanyl-tRNA synthetase beta chain